MTSTELRYAEYAEKDPTSLQAHMATWIPEVTGVDPAGFEDTETAFAEGVRLGVALRMEYQRSPENRERTAVEREEREEALEAARAERKKARAEREAAAEAKRLEQEEARKAKAAEREEAARKREEAAKLKAEKAKAAIVEDEEDEAEEEDEADESDEFEDEEEDGEETVEAPKAAAKPRPTGKSVRPAAKPSKKGAESPF